MRDHEMDAFDTRLAGLMTVYGEQAVTTFDAAAIAHTAVARRPALRVRLGLPMPTRAQLGIAVGLIALGVLALTLALASQHRSPIGDTFAAPIRTAWSPDGSTLAFLVDVADDHGKAAGGTAASGGVSPAPAPGVRPSHAELWVVDGDGGQPRRLALSTPSEPVPVPTWLRWAPDGRSILLGLASSEDQSRHSGILGIRPDGSAPRVLVDAGLDDVTIEDVSTTNDRVLYATSRSSRSDLSVLDLSSGTVRQLTSSGSAGRGSWSPDGTHIAFQQAGNGTDGETWVMAADGSDRHRVAPCCAAGWSSDGERVFYMPPTGLLYSVLADATDGDPTLELYVDGDYGLVRAPVGDAAFIQNSYALVITRPGEAPRLLATGFADDPTWSPDGRWIAYAGYDTRGAGLRAVAVDGSGVGQPVLVGAIVLGDPWRPRSPGPELAVVLDRAIVVVQPDGTGRRELVSRATIAGEPRGQSAAPDLQPGIVVGPDGPDRDIYRLRASDGLGGKGVTFTIENRNATAWAFSPIEKDSWCKPVSGTFNADRPCDVAPHSTIRVSLPPAPSPWHGWVAPAGSDWNTGYPVILELVTD